MKKKKLNSRKLHHHIIESICTFSCSEHKLQTKYQMFANVFVQIFTEKNQCVRCSFTLWYGFICRFKMYSVKSANADERINIQITTSSFFFLLTNHSTSNRTNESIFLNHYHIKWSTGFIYCQKFLPFLYGFIFFASPFFLLAFCFLFGSRILAL